MLAFISAGRRIIKFVNRQKDGRPTRQGRVLIGLPEHRAQLQRLPCPVRRCRREMGTLSILC